MANRGFVRTKAGIVLLAFALLLAGCSGASVGDGSSSDDVEVDDDDVRDGIDSWLDGFGDGSDGGDDPTPTETETDTETPTATATPTPEPGPAAVEDVEDRHRVALEEAGSFTRNRTVNFTTRGTGTDDANETGVDRVDLETGEVLVTTSSRERYRNATGAVFERSGSGDSATYLGPEEADPINVSNFTATGYLDLANPDSVSVTTNGSVNGYTGTVYEASGPDAIAADPLDVSNASGYELTTIEVQTVVGDDDVVRWARYHYVIESETDDVVIEREDTVQFTEVGTTDVVAPEWLSDAKVAIAQPDGDDVVTRTYNATGDMGEVEMAVTGRLDDLESADDIGVTIVEDPSDSTAMQLARNGSIARVDYPNEGVHNVTISFDIPESEASDINDSWPSVAFHNETIRGWDFPLTTTIYTRNNTIRATLEDPDQLDRRRGSVVSALDFDVYFDNIAAATS